jgi:hypothetical protein
MRHFIEPSRQQDINVVAALMLCATEQQRYELVSDGNASEIVVVPHHYSNIMAANMTVSGLSDPFMPARLHFHKLFQALASQWRNERNPLSSNAWDNVRNPAYLGIIGMGRDAVPFILRNLQYELKIGEPDDWFVALWAITRENPVPIESRGKATEMGEAWLEWGSQQGYFDGEVLGVCVPEFRNVERT